MKIIQIPISLIEANPDQPRKIFRDEELSELRDSIAEYGVLQPLIVRKAEGRKFFLVAGERRLRAATLAGLKTVPAVVRSFDDREVALVALVENVQRENLNFLEEARAYKKLMDEFGLTQGEIAKRVSKQQSTISNKIRILGLPEDIQEAARRRLKYLNNAAGLEDLRIPPSNHLEALRGNYEGFYSIRINNQWRIVFNWNDGAENIKIEDYH